MTFLRAFVCLSTVILASAAHAAHNLQCNGTYSGTVTRDANHINVKLQKVNTSTLSTYSAVKPTTGGNRVFVYFDTGKDRGAEYCLFVYRDFWTLRRESKPGLYNVQVGTGKTKSLKTNSTQGVNLKFNTTLIKGKINRCWNFHPGH